MYSLVRGRKNSDEMRPKSQPYIHQGMVCVHIVFKTQVWQNNKKSNNRFSGMIRNVSGDYNSPLYWCLNYKNNVKT
jgi:hypothetical protein